MGNVAQNTFDVGQFLSNAAKNYAELAGDAALKAGTAAKIISASIAGKTLVFWCDCKCNHYPIDFDWFAREIKDIISDLFYSAESVVQRRDPRTLDLDGDGLEIVGIDPAGPILFDHGGDGIKTATSWIKLDDAFLIRTG